MLDSLMKDILGNWSINFNTPMRCTVTSIDPLIIKPIPKKQYKTGDEDYPEIKTANTLLQFSKVDGVLTSFTLPLNVGDVVLVWFDRDNLTNAVILGVIV